MRTICLSVAVALLTMSFAPLASAGIAEDVVSDPCEGKPLLEYILCYIESQPLVDRLVEEADWQVAFLQAKEKEYEGHALNAALATFRAADRELYLTTIYARNVQTETAEYVTYLNGVPVRVVSYSGGVVQGECWYYLESPCPTFVTRENSGVGDMLDAGACDPNGSPVTYVRCKVDETSAELQALVANMQAHYTGVANGAVTFVWVNGLGITYATLYYTLDVSSHTGTFTWGSVANGLTYGNDLVVVTYGAVATTKNVATSECARVTAQCPYIIGSIDWSWQGMAVLA